MFRKLCFILGSLFLLSALWPLLFGIFHIGNVLCLLLGGLLFALPWLLRKTRPTRWLHRLLVTGYSLGAAVLIFFSSLMVYWGWFHQPPTENPPRTLIVLGAGLVGEYPSRLLAKRLNVAHKYLLAHPESQCIVSGGQGADEVISEAEAMERYLVAKGIPESRIIQENQSTNTRENLGFSKKLIPADSNGVILVTDGFHQCRASITAKDLGLTPLYNLSAITDWGIFPSYWMRDLPGIPLTWLETKGISFGL